MPVRSIADLEGEFVSSSNESHTILTDVRPGTPMHAAMERYWWPICLDSDLAGPDSGPLAITLLDRNFVAFRDSGGRVGLLDEHCSHRSASLLLARVEHGGIRCIYHGWQFDVSGRILDMPTVKDGRVKERILQGAYPVHEAGGVVWTYIGPKEFEPAFPQHPFFDVPETHRFTEVVVASANYTRTIEGVLDSSHVGILHGQYVGEAFLNDMAPAIEVADTDYGFCYGALREVRSGDSSPRTAARVTAFALPSSVYVNSSKRNVLISVPVTNDRTHFFLIFWDPAIPVGVGEEREKLRNWNGIDDYGMDICGLSRDTHDLPDRPRRSNTWRQNREAMQTGTSFSGLHRFIPEDFAVAASMGAIANQTKQNLVTSDIAIARMRRLLVGNAKRVQEGGGAGGLQPSQYPSAIVGDVGAGELWTSLLGTSVMKTG